MKRVFLFPVLAFFILQATFLGAQNSGVATEPQSFFKFLYGQDSLPLLELETNWGALVRNKMKEEYQEGKLRFQHVDGSPAELNIKLRARGNVRKEVCYYPPVRVKIQKKQLTSLGFEPFNDLKMVLSCRSGSRDEDYILREWLIYHLYEAVSPWALRTKLLRIRGVHEGKERVSLYAFLIEYDDELAARLNVKVLERGLVRVSGLERESYLKMCFFQYMIANTDWSVHNRHNLAFIQVAEYEGKGATVIPYDFDYAGFVSTDYAVPSPNLPIKGVGDRYFMGYKVTEQEARETAKFFLSIKDEIMKRCEDFELLDDKSKKSLTKLLSGFFDILEDEKKVVRTFATVK